VRETRESKESDARSDCRLSMEGVFLLQYCLSIRSYFDSLRITSILIFISEGYVYTFHLKFYFVLYLDGGTRPVVNSAPFRCARHSRRYGVNVGFWISTMSVHSKEGCARERERTKMVETLYTAHRKTARTSTAARPAASPVHF
jgi:hypothetical protein